MSPLVPLDPASTFVSRPFFIGESVDRRVYSGESGQSQVHPPGEANEFVSDVVTEVNRPEKKFLHFSSERPVMSYFTPVHEKVEAESWFNDLFYFVLPCLVPMGKFECTLSLIHTAPASFTSTKSPTIARVPEAIRLLYVLHRSQIRRASSYRCRRAFRSYCTTLNDYWWSVI